MPVSLRVISSSMETGSVSDIMQKGGTFLLSARCDEFLEPEGRKKAADQLKKHSIEGLIVIGGDGSLRGAEWHLPGTGYSLYFSTRYH